MKDYASKDWLQRPKSLAWLVPALAAWWLLCICCIDTTGGAS